MNQTTQVVMWKYGWTPAYFYHRKYYVVPTSNIWSGSDIQNFPLLQHISMKVLKILSLMIVRVLISPMTMVDHCWFWVKPHGLISWLYGLILSLSFPPDRRCFPYPQHRQRQLRPTFSIITTSCHEDTEIFIIKNILCCNKYAFPAIIKIVSNFFLSWWVYW